jgi:predicted DsbA family dithiol-disulfide isomerase
MPAPTSSVPAASATVTVDIWSDIACPWCYIGKRKFEQGVAAFEHPEQVKVTYHSYELSPDTPVDFDGNEVDFLSKHKGISVEQVHQMLSRVGQIAASVGLDYDFDAIRHTKTLKAHEALHFAKANGRQLELAERLFKAYFEQGEHVGHPERLADLGAEVGLDRAELLSALESGEFADDVQADLDQARSYGIQGVPFFVIDGRYGVSGAQDPEVFAAALRQVHTEIAGRSALTPIGDDDAAACADGSCEVPEKG